MSHSSAGVRLDWVYKLLAGSWNSGAEQISYAVRLIGRAQAVVFGATLTLAGLALVYDVWGYFSAIALGTLVLLVLGASRVLVTGGADLLMSHVKGYVSIPSALIVALVVASLIGSGLTFEWHLRENSPTTQAMKKTKETIFSWVNFERRTRPGKEHRLPERWTAIPKRRPSPYEPILPCADVDCSNGPLILARVWFDPDARIAECFDLDCEAVGDAVRPKRQRKIVRSKSKGPKQITHRAPGVVLPNPAPHAAPKTNGAAVNKANGWGKIQNIVPSDISEQEFKN